MDVDESCGLMVSVSVCVDTSFSSLLFKLFSLSLWALSVINSAVEQGKSGIQAYCRPSAIFRIF